MSTNDAATPDEAQAQAETPVPSIEETLKAEVEAQKNKYLYLYAEFENYKKRVIKERSELVKYGAESMVRELLPAIDNLERALEHAGTDAGAVVTGIKMVCQQFKDSLAKFGVETIPAVGSKFDPEKHEAVSQEFVPGKEPGTILKEHVRGYTLHGRLLRPAKVVVAGAAVS